MDKNLYQKIMHEYDQQRLRNREAEQARLIEIHSLIPKIKEIDDQMISLNVQKAKNRLLRGNTADNSKIEEQLNILSKKKKQLLFEHGYPDTYLGHIYRCSVCKDTGYVGQKKCSCFIKHLSEELYEQSHLKSVLEEHNFETFCLDYYSDRFDGTHEKSPREYMTEILAQSKDYVKNFDTIEKKNLLFQGSTGVGKTFLSHCIAKEIIDTGHHVLYMTSYQFFDIIQNEVFHRENSLTDSPASMHEILNCDLFILDDLGTELNNGFITSQLFLFVNERLLKNKATIISTNLTLGQLSKSYSERIVSRIVENYQIWNLYGEDIRIKKRLNQN